MKEKRRKKRGPGDGLATPSFLSSGDLADYRKEKKEKKKGPPPPKGGKILSEKRNEKSHSEREPLIGFWFFVCWGAAGEGEKKGEKSLFRKKVGRSYSCSLNFHSFLTCIYPYHLGDDHDVPKGKRKRGESRRGKERGRRE